MATVIYVIVVIQIICTYGGCYLDKKQQACLSRNVTASQHLPANPMLPLSLHVL